MRALEHPRAVPKTVVGITRTVCPRLREAWRTGRTNELDAAIKDANEKIARLGEGSKHDSTGFQIPGTTIIEGILLIHDTIMVWVADNKNASVREVTTQDIALLCLGLVQALDHCGLSFKWIVDHEAMSAIENILTEGEAYLNEDIKTMLNAFVKRDELATDFQKQAVAPAEQSLKKFFTALNNKSVPKAKQALGELEKVNVSLHTANKEEGLNVDEHELPTILLSQCISKDALALPRNERTENINQVKEMICQFLVQGGFGDIGTNLRKSFKFKEKIELGKEMTLWIDTSKKAWRRPVVPPDMSSDNAETVNAKQADTPEDTEMDSQDTPPATEPQGDPSTKPPQFDGVPGPFINNRVTRFGTIDQVRMTGGEKRPGYRVIVNVGTDKCSIHECIPGGDFGRGMGELLHAQFGSPIMSDFKKRKANHVDKILSYTEVQRVHGTGVRAQIGYFLIQYSNDPNKNPLASQLPVQEWTTRTDTNDLMGKKSVDGPNGYRETLLAQQEAKLEWLKKCKANNLHPDTGKPISLEDKQSMPWLFPVAPPGSSTGAQSRKKGKDDAGTPNVGVGDGWNPPGA